MSAPEKAPGARVVGGTLAVLRDGAAWHGATLTPEMCEAVLTIAASKERLHRRAQAAEALAAKSPDLVTLGAALDQLRQAKEATHRWRQECRYMQNERRRLRQTIADLRAERGSCSAPSPVSPSVEEGAG